MSTLTTWRELPGPRAWPLIGNALQLKPSRIHLDIEALARKHGPAFKLRFGPERVLVITDNALIHAAMRERPDGYMRPMRMADIISDMKMPLGLFTAEGDRWRAQRRMVMAAFSPNHVRAFLPRLIQVAQRLEGRWLKAVATQQVIDLQGDLMRYTVDAISGLAFGQDTNTLERDEDVIQQHLDRIFPMLAKRLTALVPYWRVFKLPSDRAFDRSLAHVASAIQGFIAQARHGLTQAPERRTSPHNLLEAMIVAADQADSSVTDEDIAGNVFIMLLAGEDTTANSLEWLLYLLHKHPHTLVTLTKEIRSRAPDLSTVTMEALNELPYLDACINEAMRLKPVVPFTIQQALRDTQLGPFAIDKGTLVWCATRVDATSEAHFKDAPSFAPSRWLAEDAAQGKRASLPFGSGPRICPGRYLSLVEMKLMMVMLLNRFDALSVSTPDNRDAQENMGFTMMPVGLELVLQKRAGVPAQ